MIKRFQLSSPLVARQRLPVVDQLKGFALILILIYHSEGVLKLPNRWGGQIGVDIFLLISGFTLALHAVEQGPRQFWSRRFWRIYPAYWVTLVFVIVLHYCRHGAWPGPRTVLIHILGLHGFGDDPMFFQWAEALWFIGLIVPLYAVTFAIRRWIDRPDVIAGVAGAATLAMSLYTQRPGYDLVAGHLPMRIPIFFLGLSLGRIALGKTQHLSFSVWLLLGGLSLYWSIVKLGHSLNDSIAALGLVCAYWGFQELLARAAPGRWVLAALAYLGTISYEIYLLHQPLIRECNRAILAAWFGLAPATRPQLLAGIVGMLGALVAGVTLKNWLGRRRVPR